MLQLVAYLPHEVQRFPLLGGRMVLGSAPDCDIRLPFGDVAEHHALLERLDDAVRIESVSTRHPLIVNGESTRSAALDVLDEIQVGKVTLLLEDPLASLEPEGSADEIGEPVSDSRPPAGRQGFLSHLSRLSSWVVEDTASRGSLETILLALLEDLGGGCCFLFQGDLQGELAVRLAVTDDPAWLSEMEHVLEVLRADVHPRPERSIGHLVHTVRGTECWICYRFSRALERSYSMIFVLDDPTAEDWSLELGLATAADLIVMGLIHHVGRYEPILPGHAGQRGLTLAPGLIIGPSAAAQRLTDQLQAVCESSSHTQLVGEEGSGRTLAARTIHLSSHRKEDRFVEVSCLGADSRRLEAELFGAEVKGKKGPVRREGKIAMASGGSLLIESIDSLDLALQARLMRVLRTGTLVGPGDGEVTEVDLRILSATPEPLVAAVAAGRLRADLAHRLSQLTVAVPPLRERLEDLPILVQTYVNRFSHEAGKRVRGITVKALSALSTYPFPGNLRELENAIRQMVYLAREEAPLDVDLLPPEIRSASFSGDSRSNAGSDLDLGNLVASVERASIREALRRTEGNKSRAAKLLGLSRNGLAQKMTRYRM
ncbi:MAG TPA: sigma 54-interacting transcriptional regulator [Thermoanaerobaculia bacterium]|nr:sigma 54-interacting transcriptional regulator [Thermoanaerobaculia bacterium]